MIAVAVYGSAAGPMSGEPNPPAWPSSVHVFDAAMPAGVVQAELSKLYSAQSMYTDARAALFFKPVLSRA